MKFIKLIGKTKDAVYVNADKIILIEKADVGTQIYFNYLEPKREQPVLLVSETPEEIIKIIEQAKI